MGTKNTNIRRILKIPKNIRKFDLMETNPKSLSEEFLGFKLDSSLNGLELRICAKLLVETG